MYVSHALITVGISVTSLMITSTMCTYYYTLQVYVHVLSSHTSYGVHVLGNIWPWNVRRSWPGFEIEGREREMAKKHALNRPGCISKHQDLTRLRQVSEGQSTMIIDALHKALSSIILSSHSLKVCKATSYA